MSQTGVVSWSQTAASNATADSNVNFAEGMAAGQVNDSARAVMASVAKWRDDNAGTIVTGGSSTAYTATSNQVFGALSTLNGQTLIVRFNATNGASPTLNVDSLGAKAINIDSTTAVATGAIRANSIHSLTYDNSAGVFILHHGHSLVEPGRIAETGLSSAPPGWVMCDGSAISRTTYADLFAAISTTFGIGDGSTTFNVPNRKGRVAVGVDSGASVITGATTLGATQGEQNHTLVLSETPSHTHTASVTDPGHTHGPGAGSHFITDGANNTAAFGSNSVNNSSTATASATTGITVTNASQGGGGSHNNMQPTIAMNFMIKT